MAVQKKKNTVQKSISNLVHKGRTEHFQYKVNHFLTESTYFRSNTSVFDKFTPNSSHKGT